VDRGGVAEIVFPVGGGGGGRARNGPSLWGEEVLIMLIQDAMVGEVGKQLI